MTERRKAALLPDGLTPGWLKYRDIGNPPIGPPPPPPGSTIFGFNNADNTRLTKMQWWGKVPCGRGYYGQTTLPSTGNGFKSGGKEFKLAGLDVAGVVSGRRVNISSKYVLGSITSSTSAKVTETYNYVRSIPAGWVVYICWHEYNRNRSAAELAQFVSDFQFLAEACWEATQLNIAEGKGQGIYVVNAAGSGLSDTFNSSQAPAASTMPPNAQFWSDAYGNPSGTLLSGYKAYGTRYKTIAEVMNDVYDVALSLGYLNNSDGGSRGWGIGETNAPRRVAPKLATLDSDLGWGPLSPADRDGTLQAQYITDACNFALGAFDPTRTIPAKVFLLWMQQVGANWNQDFSTGGDAANDDWSDAPAGTLGTVKGPHWQGFPIATDPTKPRLAYKHFIDLSA